VLSASTEESVAYRTTAWYSVIATLLFVPPTLVFSSFYYLLASKLSSLIFNTTDSHSVSVGLTLLFAYYAILVLLYGQSQPGNELMTSSADCIIQLRSDMERWDQMWLEDDNNAIMAG